MIYWHRTPYYGVDTTNDAGTTLYWDSIPYAAIFDEGTPPTNVIKSVNTVLWDNSKSINGVLRANIKSINTVNT